MEALGILFEVALILSFVAGWKSYFFPTEHLNLSVKETQACFLFMTSHAAGVSLVIWKWSASDVRGKPGETSFYLIVSLIGIVAAQILFGIFGISLRDDAAERKNRGALFAAAGLTFGATCCVAGANVGNGPGVEAVLFCFLLSLSTLFALWLLVALISRAVETITIERDKGAGVRTGAWLAGTGAVLGASVAGPWVSVGATLRDVLRFSWPLLPLALFFGWFERQMSRRSLFARLNVARSAVFATSLLILAGSYAVWVAKQ